ncbi:thioredoxin family protein [soil metagenome]
MRVGALGSRRVADEPIVPVCDGDPEPVNALVSERSYRRVMRVSSRPSISILMAILVVIACSAPTPATLSPAPTAAGYPGWPGGAEPLDPPEVIPLLISSDLAAGPNRFVFSLLDRQNELIAGPDVSAGVSFYDLAADPETPVTTQEARFQWTVEGALGAYVSSVDFPRAGDWGVEVTVERPDMPATTTRAVFPVRTESAAPGIGERVPASDTPTAVTLDEARTISTDTDPNLDFYRLSVADALEAGKPFLVIFSTPAFCRTRTCGPALDIVKDVAADYEGAEVNFLHVEPYQLEAVDGHLQPVVGEGGQPLIVPSMGPDEWNLPTEPYVAVVGEDGTLRAKFEGVAGEEELRAAIDDVLG